MFISQLKRYARTCRNYADFLYRPRHLTIRLKEQSYVATRRLDSSLKKFCGRHHEHEDGCIYLRHENWFVNVSLFPFLYHLLRTWFFMCNSASFSRKAEDAYSTGAPGPCSQFLVESDLLIYFRYLVCMILFILYSLLYLSVFHVWSLSLYYFFWFPLGSWFPWLFLH